MQEISTKLKFTELTPQRVPESAKLLAKCYVGHNQLWKALNKDLVKVQKFMENKLSQTLEWQGELKDNGIIEKNASLSFVYLNENDNNKIVGVFVNVDLMQSLTKKSKYQLKQMGSLSKNLSQLLNSIDKRDKAPGLSLRTLFVAIDQKYMNQKLFTQFMSDFSQYLHARGYRKTFTRVTNTRVEGFMLSRGADLMSTFQIDEKEIKLQVTFFKLPLSPFGYGYPMTKMTSLGPKL